MTSIRNQEPVVKFPDPARLPTTSDGLLYIGGNLNPDTLIQAYSSGIFPWPLDEDHPLFWFCPQPRGILQFSHLHVPRSLQKMQRKNDFSITYNQAFPEVIRACARKPRPGQDKTWILPAMIDAYIRFHELGFAHSVECWRENRLIGGLYGVYVKGVFSGESMFYDEPNASKLCFLSLVEKLRALGLSWIDTQMVTPVTEQLGGEYISREEFLRRLKATQKLNSFFKLKLQ